MNDTTRDAFEAWVSHLDISTEQDGWQGLRYTHSHVQAMWEGWQAATEQSKRQLQWLPIADAPKDATAILVMRDIWPGTKSGRAETCNAHNTYVAAWWQEENNQQGAWVCYMDAVLDPNCPIDPTHYMPLPLPPTATPQGNHD